MSLASADQLLALLEQLYASVLAPAATANLLRTLDDVFGNAVTRVHCFDRVTGEVQGWQASDPAFDDANRAYAAEWSALDPIALAFPGLPSGEVLRCTDQLTPKEAAASPFYREFLLPLGLRWRFAGVVHGTDGSSIVIGGVRHPDAPPYGESEARLLRQLMPHFERAALLREQLEPEGHGHTDLLRVLEHLPGACLILDGTGRIVAMNSRARTVLPQLPLRIAGSQAHFASAEHQREWTIALRIASGRVSSARFAIAHGGIRWCFQVVSWRVLGVARDARDGGLLLVSIEPERGAAPRRLEAFAAMVGLTRAEAEVLDLLSSGHSAKQIAKRRGASVHTVRSQITAILAKSHCRSQRELLTRLTGAKSS